MRQVAGRLPDHCVAAANRQPLPDFGREFEPPAAASRHFKNIVRAERPGQGAFRLQILETYNRRWAAAAERASPVLDAAHIEPYRGRESDRPPKRHRPAFGPCTAPMAAVV